MKTSERNDAVNHTLVKQSIAMGEQQKTTKLSHSILSMLLGSDL